MLKVVWNRNVSVYIGLLSFAKDGRSALRTPCCLCVCSPSCIRPPIYTKLDTPPFSFHAMYIIIIIWLCNGAVGSLDYVASK
jgi:hypothetical protein